MQFPQKVFIVALFVALSYFNSQAQLVTTSPVFPTGDSPVTITFDVTKSNDSRAAGLLGLTSGVYLWSGCGSTANGNAFQFQPSGQTNFNQAFNPGTMTSLGNNKWSITITPRNYFNVPAGTPIVKMGLLLKNTNGSAQTEDFIQIVYGSELNIAITTPANTGFLVNQNDMVSITAQTSKTANITFSINGVDEATQNGVNTHFTTVTASMPIKYRIIATAVAGMETARDTAYFLVRQTPPSAALPNGIIDGINYTSSTSATLSLLAPNKKFVYLIGDFNNWELDPAYLMNKTPDGNRHWLALSGLTSMQEYAFQYVVFDNNEASVKVGEPYCDKILDPDDDKFIPASTYPNLKAYPNGKTTGMVSVLQTGQSAYNWQVTNFSKPAKSDLVIYELLLRDFLFTKKYASLIDTLDYLATLGVNAIELMPINEFKGNNSWGYNPNFFLAPDKYYGTKNDFKKLIDECHARGIAVIMDIALNHAHETCPLAALYYDYSVYKPTSDNPWFNRDAKHPFNVFNDFNHEAQVTKDFVDRVVKYWLTEYKIDGFRFDLSKGFTQTFNTDVGLWSAYDASRVALWKRIADVAWAEVGDAYIILEHFAANSEEKELAEYRSGEGKGMMFWGNMTHAYGQNSLGFGSDSDISGTYAGTGGRGWTQPHLIAYMESHDEERIMYKNIQFGNSSANYNIKSLSTALNRVKAAAAFFYTIPGPKMLWQFGELGYDFSINQCENGTVNNNCRLDLKPIRWDYLDNAERFKIYKTFQALIDLKQTYPVFKTTDVTISGGTNLAKQITLKANPFTATPANANQMSVVIIGNFGVTSNNFSVNFPHTGNWYHYFAGGTVLNITNTNTSINLAAGEFRVYTNVALPAPEAELMPFVKPNAPINAAANGISDIEIRLTWTDASSIESGFKILRANTLAGTYTQVGTATTNTTAYVDRNGLLAQTQYFYKIVATNDFGDAESGIATGTTTNVQPAPTAPSNLTATPNMAGTQVNLAWTDNSGNNETGFVVERSITAGSGYMQIAYLEANKTAYSDLSVTLGAMYFYRVAAAKGSSKAYSNEASSGLVALEDQNLAKAITIYPNPSEGKLFIGIDNLPFQKMQIKLLDVSGKELKIIELEDKFGQNELRIQDLPKGFYLLEFKSEKGYAVKKFIRN